MGTWGAGLHAFDRATGRFTRYRHDPTDPSSISSDHILDIYEDAAGRLWVETYNGLNRLDHRQKMLTFEFVVLHYLNPEQNRYAYRLDGFDEEWVMAGAQRSATYTNLPPGEYVFRVKAANSDGVWNEEGISVRLVILPPFWRTPWFYALCVLGLFAAAYVGYRVRIRHLRAQARALEALVADRTQALAAEKQKTEEQAQRLLDLARIDSDRMEVHLQPGDVAGFLRGLVRAFVPLAERRQITLQFQSEPSSQPLRFDPEKLERVDRREDRYDREVFWSEEAVASKIKTPFEFANLLTSS